eukprot:CAMPEP_0177218014 /NCGR_PEP_ID=MMETSP0367-20130122/35587_1 /TAXON_ID=447022 ORGANISM="Scrippsiella hangoei-like, Strain SHHI-4" /NCGR_SAMPLE_ID=MMETSP0367 /ASSEMBLY_ACC=CAM_ASM_000362 /LENGTH=63 /DNA_ID=CAMNT_0018667613 /DNA_START=68 /DNA_END=255 /DNA_ORIENTATION=-
MPLHCPDSLPAYTSSNHVRNGCGVHEELGRDGKAVELHPPGLPDTQHEETGSNPGQHEPLGVL